MKNHTVFTLSSFIAFGALLLSPSSAQTQGRDTIKYGREQPLNGNANEPHQVLAMAYRDNLVTFAKVLRGNENTTSPMSPVVDKDIAKTAVDEMRRAFNKLSDENKDQTKDVTRNTNDSTKTILKNRMDAQLDEIDQHIDVLEKTVKESAPDAKLISQHVSAILTKSAGMWTADTRATRNPPPPQQ